MDDGLAVERKDGACDGIYVRHREGSTMDGNRVATLFKNFFVHKRNLFLCGRGIEVTICINAFTTFLCPSL